MRWSDSAEQTRSDKRRTNCASARPRSSSLVWGIENETSAAAATSAVNRVRPDAAKPTDRMHVVGAALPIDK